MPRYFLHLYNDVEARDEEGREFADLDDARAAAVRGARDVIAETVSRDGRLNLSHRIDVEDEDGRVLLSVPFSEAVEVSG